MNRFLKRIAVAVLSMLLPASIVFAQASTREFAPVQNGYVAAGDQVATYAPGRVVVKFTRDAARQVQIQMDAGGLQRSAVGLSTGLATFDAEARGLQLQKLERTLRYEPRDLASVDALGADRWYTLEFDGPTDARDIADRLAKDPNVESATVDWRAFPAAVPNDPLHADHWGHNNTAQLNDLDWGGTYAHTLPNTVGTPGFDANAEQAWDGSQGYGSSSVIIAIVDSGVDVGHPDLVQVAGYDYGDNDSNPDDDSAQPGHGTACAGVAAASANNGLGTAGIAANSRIMPLKVANSAGSMYFSSIINAIYFAADNGADVISMSLGAAISSDAQTDAAIQYAYNAGCVLLAATGNENASSISYPANNAYVVGVGAASPCGERKRSSSSSSEVNPGVSTDPNGYTCDGERWWGSNYGVGSADAAGAVDIIAPTILPTTDIQGSGGYSSGDYDGWFNGTSCATPYAAGVVALIKAKNPGWSPAQLRNQLVNTADDVTGVESGSGWDRYTGYGMVDAAAAVDAGAPSTNPPVAAFTGTPTSGTFPLTVNFTDQSTENPTGWAWTFGDGGSSSQQNPSHTYTAAGTYTVTLTASNAYGSDGETKTGYVTVSDPADLYASLPYSTGFESGSLDQYWTTSEGVEGRIVVTTDNQPYAGSYHLRMDDAVSGGSYSQNEAWLLVNLAGESQVDLEFQWKEIGDENHSQDGIYFSDDGGASFTKVLDLNGQSYTNNTWQAFQLDVDALAGSNGLSLTSQFVVKFQQYDNYPVNSDGFCFDDVSVTGGPAGSPPVAEFSGTPTSGFAPLQVQFTDASTGGATSWSWDFGDGGSSSAQNPSHTYTSAGTYTVTLTASNAFGSDGETKTNYVTVSSPPSSATIGEVGVITRNQTGNGADWYTVNLNNSYSAPVVVMRGLTTNGGHKTHLRARNVSSGSFEWQQEEWDYHDGNHTTEDAPYMVMEAGSHTLDDGTLVEAGTLSVSTGWVTVNFGQSFSGTPVLLTGVASDNDAAAVITRTRNLGSGSFQIKLQEEEAADDVHANETVSWIAIEAGVGDNDGSQFEAARTPNAVTDQWYSISFSPGMGSSPIFLCHDDTYDGANTCGTRYRNASASGVEVFIEEEQSADSEVGHISEVVSWLAWSGPGDIKAQVAGQEIELARAVPLPTRFDLSQNRPNPFNPITTIDFALPQSSDVHVAIFDTRGRRVAVLAKRRFDAGTHSLRWDATAYASGVYFYRIQAGEFVQTRRMTLIK